ncbi:MAG: NUDIX domain-containing protein [Pseudomonadota bacterium]
MSAPLFFFGTLCYVPLLEQVLGRAVEVETARAEGVSVYWVAGASYPTLQEGGAADGLVLRDATADDIARLDFYEGAFGYALVDVTVHTAAGPLAAQMYRSDEAFEIGAPWSFKDWIATHGAITLEAASEVMEGFGQISPKTVAQRFPMIRARAGAVVNAQRQPSAASASGLTASDVEVADTRRPYTHYFSLKEMTLRHRRYDGAMSPQVERAVFVATDVALVLPYDPVRDRVLLVEQFRMGPFVRGDRHPWSLEPIAGRIDTVETAEETARREAMEEAGLELGMLHLISRCYPSPGASTEHFTTYLGIADLPDDVTGIGGLASEHEDIRSTLVSFDDLVQMARDDALSNAPLVMAVWWLAAHRAELRG